jgi:hypothetical protein
MDELENVTDADVVVVLLEAEGVPVGAFAG